MKVLLFTTILLSGLVAGLLYAYSCAVTPGLKALPDPEYIRAMQSINNAIQNPFFFCSFIGLLLVYPFTAYFVYKQQAGMPFYLVLAAGLAYLIGVFGITVCCNIPLNEQLARFSVSTATTAELSAVRQAFEKPWNNYHIIRTIAGLVAFGLSVLCLAKQKP